VHMTAKAKASAITKQALQPKAAKQQRSKTAYADDGDSADDGSDADEDKLFVEEKDDSDSKFVRCVVAKEQLKPLE